MDDESHVCAEPAGHGEDVMHQCVCGTVELPPAAHLEPAAAPAEPVQDAPADTTAPAGTPDGSAVLGRALLDDHDNVWLAVGDDEWTTRVASIPRSRSYLEAGNGRLREVLLVSPSAREALMAALVLAAA